MKLSTILCGAAAVALVASSAQATNWGHPWNPGNPGGGTPTTGTSGTGPWGEYAKKGNNNSFTHPDQHNWALANSTSDPESRWAAEPNMAGNVGDAGKKDGAKFTLSGKVTPHCVFYTGDTKFGGTLSFDLGTIGIYASENHNLQTAFDPVSGSSWKFSTNVAGCNTKNQVVLKSTNNALVANVGTLGYDRHQFTKELPFTVVAKFKPVSQSGGAQTASTKTLTLSGNTTTAGQNDTYGAWKSPLNIDVIIGNTDKSLVAGEYSGGFEIIIETK